ncbi:PAS domain-containing protein [Jannaschia formosa]|uniref:PAS domain-containing protein n=1 Tax=Jannaschia formosa TaxID=2259592 RepID=UPI000E1B54CE|nr:PAS domain-containing protein [Jannaschia formosa]TFL18886.1 PAS domain-containing protein [Jannaschia formosa]
MPDSATLDERTFGPLSDSVLQMLEQVRLPLCVTNPNMPDDPIVYVNPAFLELTGYEAQDVMGRNCRFLQGPGTTPESLQALRESIKGDRVTTVEIVNYRKDGTRFDNALQIGPIIDAEGQRVLHFGSQLDVTDKRAAEREAIALEMQERTHRLRNIINVMAITVRMTAREVTDVESFAKIVSDRLQLLGAAHLRTFEDPDATTVSDTVAVIMNAYAPLGERQYRLSGASLRLPPAQITPLTLSLHELATNAVKYGAFSDNAGHIDLSWERSDGELRLTWQERGGPEVTPPTREGGSKIVQSVLRNARGNITYDWAPEGLTAVLTLPA